MSHTLALWISVFLLLGNAFFVGAEFAAMAARRSSVRVPPSSRIAFLTFSAVSPASPQSPSAGYTMLLPASG